MAKAHQIEGWGQDELEVGRSLHPAGESLRELDVPLDVISQAVHAVVADHEPELERPESPSRRNLPVPIVEHRAGVARHVLEIFGKDAERLDEARALAHVKHAAVEIGEHPLMRIEAVAVGPLEPGLQGPRSEE